MVVLMNRRNPLLNVLLVLPLFAGTAAYADDNVKLEEGFTWIFDGKTLKGWEGNLKWFRVQDGAIIAGSLNQDIPNNEFLCTTKSYGDFELRLQARLVGENYRNAGIQFRSKRIENHHEVIGYQCDMGVMGENNIWGWLYDESRRRKFLVEAPQKSLVDRFRKDDWNDVVIRCERAKIKVTINGVTTVDYTEKDGAIARQGIIGLQVHGGPAQEASYRKIRIKPLGH